MRAIFKLNGCAPEKFYPCGTELGSQAWNLAKFELMNKVSESFHLLELYMLNCDFRLLILVHGLEAFDKPFFIAWHDLEVRWLLCAFAKSRRFVERRNYGEMRNSLILRCRL